MSAVTRTGGSPVRNVNSPEAVDALAASLVDPSRGLPIVAVTSRAGETHSAMDVEVVREIVGDEADVVFLVNGPFTWRLGEALPYEQLGVFGGAARIWWPGVGADSDPYDHPLIQDRYGVYGTQAEGLLKQVWRKGPPKAAEKPTDTELLLLRRQHATLETAFQRQRDELHVAEREVRALRERLAVEGQRARARRSSDAADGTEAPLDRELAFAIEVLIAWHEHFPPGQSDRDDYPLGRYRPLSGFLADVEALQPADRNKLPEVVAMVVCGRAPQINGMNVHPLRLGEGASDSERVRGSDGARARRVAVRRKTPDAAQLHYWSRDDGIIDLASVRGHKYLGIPES